MESFLGSEPRLVQGLYSCTIFCDQETNSKVFEVLSKRHSKILSSDYQELTNMFIINALVPIQESFGFHSEMMIATSGRVIPELKFSGWKMIEEDPFYEPKTHDVNFFVHAKFLGSGGARGENFPEKWHSAAD